MKQTVIGTIIFLLFFLGGLAFFFNVLDKPTNYQTAEDKNKATIDTLLHVLSENSYFEGQKDALNGKLRIKQTINGKDTTYTWTSSPWDNGRTPIFDPSKK